MKNKYIALTCAALIAAVSLLGLLSPAANPAHAADRAETSDLPVGYYLTFEHLDLYDPNAWLEDDLDALLAGKEPSYDDAYAGRLYAELVPDAEGPAEDYVFPGADGIPFFTAYVTDEAGSYIRSVTGEGITDGRTHYKSTDDGEERILEGTVCLVAGEASITGIAPPEDGVVYFNPVFQDSEGRIYLTQGSGYFFSGDRVEGSVYTQNIKGEVKRTVNGETTVEASDVTIHLALMIPPERVTVTEMGADDRVIASHELTPGAYPESYVPSAEAAYLLVSEHAEEKVTRSIVEQGESVEVFDARENGLCVKQTVEVMWG